MADFIFANGSYLNLDRVVSIEPDVDESGAFASVHYASGYSERVKGNEATALMAHIRGEPEQRKVSASANTQAAEKAQELARTLGGSSRRRFDFVDLEGQNRRGTVYKDSNPGTRAFGWTAEVDGVKYAGSSEAGAMSAAMGAAG